jgi:hypothetical protein
MSAQDLLRGAIDVHVHSYPDVRPRRLDDLQLVEQAAAAGMRALVLKSHVFSTAERAYLANRIYPEFRTFGGIVLNATVGGFNLDAVDAALKMGAVQVWMPTVSAANHARYLGGGGILTAHDERGELRTEVITILERIAQRGAALGTGHLSREESRLLIPAAIAIGVRHVVVTHPEWECTAIPVEWQREWAATGRVYFDRCLVSTSPELPGHVPLSTVVDQIRTVGVATTIMSTDYGLDGFPTPVEGLREYIRSLLSAGFADEDIRVMVQHNPARLLGLERHESGIAPVGNA